MESLRELLDEDQISNLEPNPSAELLRPTPPIVQTESNWPLLTVTKACSRNNSNDIPETNFIILLRLL